MDRRIRVHWGRIIIEYYLYSLPLLISLCLANLGTCLGGALDARHRLANLGTCLGGELPARQRLANLGTCLGGALGALDAPIRLANLGTCLCGALDASPSGLCLSNPSEVETIKVANNTTLLRVVDVLVNMFGTAKVVLEMCACRTIRRHRVCGDERNKK